MHNGYELSPFYFKTVYVLTIYICKIDMSSSLSRAYEERKD